MGVKVLLSLELLCGGDCGTSVRSIGAEWAGPGAPGGGGDGGGGAPGGQQASAKPPFIPSSSFISRTIV